MKERPILFSSPMVRAILEGRKTQTRRVFKGLTPPNCAGIHTCKVDEGFAKFHLNGQLSMHEGEWTKSPYEVRDRLWVKETFAWHLCAGNEDHEQAHYRADSDCCPRDGERIRKWKPSIFMPRAASRITLEITGVRVERLNEIKATDCIAEGIEPYTINMGIGSVTTFRNYRTGNMKAAAITSFETLWDSINAKTHPWASNPWVWVLEFRKL